MTSWRSLARVARLASTERRELWLSVALGFGAVACAGGLLATSGYLISRAAQRPEILTLTGAIVAVRAFGIARAVLRYGERLASHDLALRMLARLRVRFFGVLAPLVPGSLRGRTRGELLSRFVGDVDSLQDLYLRALGPPVVAALVILGAGLTAYLMLPAAALVVVASLLASAVLVPFAAASVAAAAGRRQAPARAELTAELVEAIDGGAELAVAGRGEQRAQALHEADTELAALARRDSLAAGAATSLGSLVGGLAVLGALLIAVPAVHSGALSGVLLAALVFLVLASFEGTAALPAAARRLRTCAEAAHRLEELSALEPAVRDPQHPVAAPATSLSASGIWFRHGSAEPWLLADADLTLHPGSRTALIGESGAGKTTLAHLLVRFIDPVRGTVALGGVDLRAAAQEEVRAAVVLAAQDAQVFTTTIRENLLLARRGASSAELWRALEATCLADYVRSLPDGLDTMVGEDGDLLSGGQRHRLALARALVSEARFLILDEPTAHVDRETAAEMMARIERATSDRGLLVITHHAEHLERFDEVLELRDGDLVRVASARVPTLAA